MSDKSDTPRTDEAKAMATVPFEKPEVILVTECVPADFSRQLERELAAVKEAFESSKKVAIIASAKLADTRAELAAANKLIDDEKTGKLISYLNVLAQENKTLRRMSHADRAEKAEAERDALREALEEINLMACYASEEDTDSREAMLLKIGESARAAIDAARAK